MNRSVIVPSRPLKVNRARSPEGADTTQRHLGHALGGKAGNEAVAQVAHAADVDVAHRVVVSTRKDGEEVEVLRGYCRLPSPRRCPKRSQTRP